MGLIKNFKWTNDDQNEVSTYIAKDGMSPDDAAKKWVDANPDKVDAWLEAEPDTLADVPGKCAYALPARVLDTPGGRGDA